MGGFQGFKVHVKYDEQISLRFFEPQALETEGFNDATKSHMCNLRDSRVGSGFIFSSDCIGILYMYHILSSS